MSVKILYEGGASGVLFTDRRNFYPEPNIVYSYHKDVFPFLTFLSQLETKQAPDRIYKLFEDRPSFVNQQFTVDVETSVVVPSNGSESDAITVTDPVNLPSTVTSAYKNLMLEIWDSTLATKKGVVVVTSVPSDTTIKVKSAKASSVTIEDGDIAKVIGNVRGEVSVAPEAFADELSVVWNSTQYFSTAVEISAKLKKAAEAAGFRGSPELARLRMKKLYESKMQVQNAFLRGVSSVGTNMNGSDSFNENNLRTITDSEGNTSVFTTTYGYIPILEDYGITWNGTGSIDPDTNIFKVPLTSLNYNTMADISKVIFDKRTTDTAYAFCGLDFINELAKKAADSTKFGFQGKMQLGDQKFTQIGLAIREILTPGGLLYLVPMKGLLPPYSYSALIPNQDAIGIMEFEQWTYKTNVKTDNDYNAQKDVYSYDAGIWMTLLETHHMITLTS